MICDEEGIPKLIQKIRYMYGGMWFEVLFFNGKTRLFSSDDVCPSLGLLSHPDKMQMLEAQNNIEKFALKFWQNLFHGD